MTTKRRSSLLPEVPTIAEAGVVWLRFPIWYGVWAPAGTPAKVVDNLATDIRVAMSSVRLCANGLQSTVPTR